MVAALLGGAAVLVIVLASRGGPAPTPMPAPSPTPQALPQPEPFTVELTAVNGRSLDSGNLYARPERDRPQLTRNAARGAVDALQRYLNRAFVVPETRFTQPALHGFMTKPAQRELTGRMRSALGVGAPEIGGGTTRGAHARATVLYRNNRAVAVMLRHRARLDAVWPDGRDGRYIQEGTILFARAAGGWRAEMLDVHLTLPDPPEPSGPTEAPTNGEGS